MIASTQEYLDKLAKMGPKNRIEFKGSMQRGDEFKYVTAKFDPKKFPKIELIHITDVQYGHKYCNVARFVELRQWILASPNRFVLFGGDMVDAATALSVQSPYENTMEPREQVLRFVELALPIRHRIVGYVGGNHERRAVKSFGDLGHLIATLLRVPYSSGQQFIDIEYGQHRPFKCSLWHGGGAAKTKGAKAQLLDRFMTQADSHVYWVGHLHDSLVLPGWRQHRVNGEIQLRKVAGVMSSSFLDYWGTFAEVAGLVPSDTMMGRVILEPSGRWEITVR